MLELISPESQGQAIPTKTSLLLTYTYEWPPLEPQVPSETQNRAGLKMKLSNENILPVRFPRYVFYKLDTTW